jgi:uncharacterized protein YjbI with pentapeptide repeats
MIKILRSWWQRTNKPLFVIAVMVFLVAVIVIVLGYWLRWSWTGFLEKTLWDWLQLLFVPIMLAIGGFWLNQIQKSREERTTQQQAELERELTRDNQQEILLQAYIDKMSELLLDKDNPLRESKPEDEVRKIASVRTLTVFPRLNSNRKRSVLQFLHGSSLIDVGKSIIDLRGADLQGANLQEADLREAKLWKSNLQGANLQGAKLGRANLQGADLQGANLEEATPWEVDLGGANLRNANLRGANLQGTDLRGTDLQGANLQEADLQKANLQGAKVTQEQLKTAKLLQGTILPDA